MGPNLIFYAAGAVLLAPALLLWPHNGRWVVYVIASGLLSAIGSVTRFRALALGELSLLAPLVTLNLSLVAVLSAVFLREPLTLTKGLGTLLVLIGVGGLKGGLGAISLRWVIREPAARCMLVYAVATASMKIIDRAGVQEAEPIFYAAAQTLVMTLLFLTYLVAARKGADIRRAAARGLGLTVGAGLLNTLSYLAFAYAVRSAEVSVVEPLAVTSVVVTAVLGRILHRENLVPRLPALFTIVVGAAVVVL